MLWPVLTAVFFCAVLVLLYLRYRDRRDLKRLLEQIDNVLDDLAGGDFYIPGRATYLRDLVDRLNRLIDKQRQDTASARAVRRQFKHSMSHLSHDLRTPLTSAIGYVEMLRETSDDQEDLRRLDIVRERLYLLQTLLEQLFRFIQAEDEGQELQLQRLAVDNFLRDHVALCYDSLADKGLDLILDFNAPQAHRYLDPDAMERILSNLLQNTERYAASLAGIYTAQRGDELELVFWNDVPEASATALFQLKDDGRLPELLERFQRLDTARQKGATGLGLAIVDRYVDKMHGSLAIDVLTPEDLRREPPVFIKNTPDAAGIFVIKLKF